MSPTRSWGLQDHRHCQSTGMLPGLPWGPPRSGVGGRGRRPLTCAVGQIALGGRAQVVDIVATSTGLHLDRRVPQAAVATPVRAGCAAHYALVTGRVRAIEPHGRGRVTVQDRHTGLRQAHTARPHEAVPAAQAHVAGVTRPVLGTAPVLIQDAVLLAWVRAYQRVTLGHAVQSRPTGARGALAVFPVPQIALRTDTRVIALAIDTGGQGVAVAEPGLSALIHVGAAQPGRQSEAVRAGAQVGARHVHAAAVLGAVVGPRDDTFIQVHAHKAVTSETHLAGACCDSPVLHAGGIAVTFRAVSCGQKSPASEWGQLGQWSLRESSCIH